MTVVDSWLLLRQLYTETEVADQTYQFTQAQNTNPLSVIGSASKIKLTQAQNTNPLSVNGSSQ